MASLQAITFLQDVRESLRHPDPDPSEQRPFTFEKPHTCTHCETVQVELEIQEQGTFTCIGCIKNAVRKVPETGEYTCSNCGRHFGPSSKDTLLYTATLDHNIPQAVDAAQSGCEMYRWITAETARHMPTVANKWETQEVMDAIAASCRFEISGFEYMYTGKEPKNRGALLNFQLVCPSTISEDIQENSISLGSLPVWAAARDPASKYFPSRPYELDVTSQESMRFAKDCFSACMDRHNWCRSDQIGYVALDRKVNQVLPREEVSFGDVPTRLIDVGTSNSPLLRLVETADDNGSLMEHVSNAGFMALSYCWGGEQQAKLLEDKVADYKRSINPVMLSQTLQDAVWVARTTGFRYLWIDSLCIHQDDVDGQGNNPDKALEITRMASYYGRATITLCAASSERAADGFLEVRKDVSLAFGPVVIQLRSKDTGHAIGRVYLVEENKEPWAEAITTRGWTLQESLLSRRMLIFGRHHVYWSCLNSFGGCGGSISTLVNRTTPGVEFLDNGISPAGSMIAQPTERQWANIVKEYTTRNLGREGDKLWAVAALAQHMVSMSKARGEDPVYAAGLLVNQAKPGTWLAQLLWHPVTPDSKRPMIERAPSWSWASVDGPVEVPSGQKGPREYAAVKDWEVDLLVKAAPYGGLSGGRMTLAAKMQPMSRVRAASTVSWGDWGDVAHLDDHYYYGPWGREEGSENRWVLVLLADCPDDRKTIEVDLKNKDPERSNLLLVAILPLEMAMLVGVQGLVVSPAVGDSSGGSYRRVGGFQLRAGRQTRERPESGVFRFFGEAETKPLRIV